MLYIIGHKKPDTDSIAAAVAYSYLLNKLGVEAKACRIGDVNPETEFVFSKFGVEIPEKIFNSPEKKFVLVDHNEFYQSIDDLKEEQVVGIVDHHKLSVSFLEPKFVRTEPLGSTCSIVFKMFKENNIEIPKEIAYLLLSAILSDTVIFTSPTTTEEDRKIASELAEMLDFGDLKEFGIEMKKAKANLSSKTARDIITMDFKEYERNGKKYAIGQIELVDLSEINSRKEEILSEMKKLKEENGFDLICLMVTDIINQFTDLWFVGEDWIVVKAFGKEVEDNSIHLPNVLSRKKQVVPPIEKALS